MFRILFWINIGNEKNFVNDTLKSYQSLIFRNIFEPNTLLKKICKKTTFKKQLSQSKIAFKKLYSIEVQYDVS